MSNPTKSIGKVCLAGFLLLAPALAQNRVRSGPVPAATGPSYDVSVGYTSLSMDVPGAGRANLNGLDVTGRMDLNQRWGAALDSSFVRTANVLDVQHQAYVLSVLSGPVFYPVERRNTRMFLHALGGMGLVDGAAPTSSTKYFHGWLSRPSFAAGGGIDHAMSGPFALHLSADYVRTDFYDHTGAVKPQNNLRLTVGVVFPYRKISAHPGR
jgi:outer membrane protein with beta-barrel domain